MHLFSKIDLCPRVLPWTGYSWYVCSVAFYVGFQIFGHYELRWFQLILDFCPRVLPWIGCSWYDFPVELYVDFQIPGLLCSMLKGESLGESGRLPSMAQVVSV